MLLEQSFTGEDEPDGTSLSALYSDKTKTTGKAIKVYVNVNSAKLNL